MSAPRFALAGLLLVLALDAPAAQLAVGSKNFNESYLLAEIVSQLLESRGHEVTRRFGMGGTLICYEALAGGEIDAYVEYTGTVAQVILRSDARLSDAELRDRVEGLGLRMLAPLGFDNTYALAMDADEASRRGIRRISDLVDRDDLAFAFSHEFKERADGWPGLSAAYGFALEPVGIEHGLAYQAIANGRIDVTDAYSTDGDLERYGLTVLDDDRDFFPAYRAVPLLRADVGVEVASVIELLAGRLDDASMRALNARVVVDKLGFAEVARNWLDRQGLVAASSEVADGGLVRELISNTVVHLQLTGIALGLACLIGLPLAVLVHNAPGLSRLVLYGAGLLQTIPSIALLALMIPLFGIGRLPAVIALFLYSLLPILRSTVTALTSTDPVLRRVAEGMGLTRWQQIRWLTLPLAMPNLMAGVRTAAVISIGTATLAAFVGAGGLGQPIVTGLALNDPGLILRGAIPAAALAVLTELVFEALERVLIPRHLADAARRA